MKSKINTLPPIYNFHCIFLDESLGRGCRNKLEIIVRQSFTSTEFGVLLCSGFELVVITNLSEINKNLEGLNYTMERPL